MAELTDTYDKINEELNKSGDNYTKAARTVICTEICGHMFEQGFTLDQISKSMPWLDKSDIMGLSLMLNDKPVSATDEDMEDIKWEFRRERKPKILEKLFNTPEEQAKRRFRVNPFCPNPECGEEHAYFSVKLTDEEISKMDEFYNKNDETNNYNDIGINLMEEPPVVIDREFVCPVCRTKFRKAVAVYRTDEIGYRREGFIPLGEVPV